MNLLEKAKIITTATAYDNGELHSVKGGTDADFDVVRGSLATRVNAEGLIEDISVISGELVANGDFSNGSTDWDLGAGWSISNGKAVSDTTQGYIVQTNIGGAGVTATYKIQWIQNITAGTRLRFFARNYNDSGNATILSITRDDGLIIGGGNCIGSGTFTAYVSSTNGYSFKLLAEAGVEADISNISGIETIDATNIPRIDYSTGEGVILTEPQSTNTINSSNTTSAMGYHGGLIRGNDAATSPDNTLNAMSFIATAVGGAHRTGYSSTAGLYSQNDIVTFSGFIKANGYNFVTMGGFFGQEKAVFNISDGTLVSQESNVINTEVVKLTNDWYRLSTTYTFQNSIGNGYLYAGIYVMETATSTSFTGDGVSGVYGYGFQAELGTGTSYIPTNGAIATRLADSISGAGSTDLINSEEGVLYAEIAALSDDGTVRIISLSQDGNTDNRINIFYTSGSNKMKFTVRVNNSNVFDNTITLSNILDYNKVALKYKENSFSIYINGVKEQEQLSGSTYPANTLNKLNFNQGSSNYDFFGKTKAVAVWKEALSDEELTCLTTI